MAVGGWGGAGRSEAGRSEAGRSSLDGDGWSMIDSTVEIRSHSE